MTKTFQIPTHLFPPDGLEVSGSRRLATRRPGYPLVMDREIVLEKRMILAPDGSDI